MSQDEKEKGNALVKQNPLPPLNINVAEILKTIEIPRIFNQLVIFLLDGSGSMTYKGKSGRSKGQEVHEAVVDVMQRLIESKNKNSFDAAFWAFAKDSVNFYPLKSVTQYNLKRDCFNPTEYVTDHSETILTETLDAAGKLATEYLEKHAKSNSKVLIITLGDGAIANHAKACEVKKRIEQNSNITFCSILFESPDWQKKYDAEVLDTLKTTFTKLASTSADYMSSVDPSKIRDHMIHSITKVSKVV